MYLFSQRVEELELEDTMDYKDYYTGYSLLKSLDLNHKEPAIYICSGNRTAGKTFFFKRFLIRYCLKYGVKVLIITRKRTQVKNSLHSFISDVQNCDDFLLYKFKVDTTEIAGIAGIKIGNGDPFIYCTYYNYAGDLKEASNMFSDVDIILKDEFQSETNDYVENEIIKFRSIHKSISRGFGSRQRDVKCILCGNEISIINPYYLALGITDRVNSDTKRLRGKGWVLERTFNKSAAEMSSASPFEQAFGEDEYALSANYNVYLDNKHMIQKLNTGNMKYIFTLKSDNKYYGVWNGEYYYVSKKLIPNFKRVYSTDLKSHDQDTIMINRGNLIFQGLVDIFNQGGFVFESQECKTAGLKMLGKVYI